MKKPLSKASRDRLLRIAIWLENIATRIRGYTAARTPRRGPRKRRVRVAMSTHTSPVDGNGTPVDA